MPQVVLSTNFVFSAVLKQYCEEYGVTDIHDVSIHFERDLMGLLRLRLDYETSKSFELPKDFDALRRYKMEGE